MASFRLLPEYDEALAGALAAVYQQMPPHRQTFFNDPYYWLQCRVSGRARPFTLAYYEGETLIGAAPFVSQPLKIGGVTARYLAPLGYGLSEFTAFIVHEPLRPRFWNDLVAELRRRGMNAVLPNVRPDDYRVLERHDGLLLPWGDTPNPVYRDPEGAYAGVLQKKKLKRDTDWAFKDARVTVHHFVGDIPEEAFDRLAAHHIERRAFENTPSIFSDPGKSALYRRVCLGFQPGALVRNAPVLTEIRLGSDVLATHLGFMWNRTFLTQIPVMNIACLDLSPGKVMTRALFEFARDRELTCFDFGYGEEPYKSRYTNQVDLYRTYVVTATRSRRLLLPVLKTVRDHPLTRTLSARGLKSGSLRAWLRGLRPAAFRILEVPRQAPPDPVLEPTELDFRGLVEYVRRRPGPDPVRRAHYERFKAGYRLFTARTETGESAMAWLIRGSEAPLPGVRVRAESEHNWIVAWPAPSDGSVFRQLALALARRFDDVPTLVPAEASGRREDASSGTAFREIAYFRRRRGVWKVEPGAAGRFEVLPDPKG